MQKTVPPLFIAFSNWYGFLWPLHKISGCVSLAPRKHFSHKGPPLNSFNFSFSTGRTLMKKCNKKWWDSFLHISLGLNSLPGSCGCLMEYWLYSIFCRKGKYCHPPLRGHWQLNQDTGIEKSDIFSLFFCPLLMSLDVLN